MYTTRFNPSANGGLHLGHIYMALINQAVARESGGGFTVRWDDSNPPYLAWGRPRLNAICAQQREELEWLGIVPDAWIKQSDIIDGVFDELRRRGWREMTDDTYPMMPELLIEPYIPLYPCTPMLTATKVIIDWMHGVNLLVRGMDLLSEYGMYQYYCQVLDVPQPRHVYLPRLRIGNMDISKTHGTNGAGVADLRGLGYDAAYILDLLARACLNTIGNGWTLENLRSEPRL